jgi:hypothetical protein
MENQGGGSFGALAPLDTSESRPLLATVADVDGDGDTDIIRSSSINDELGLLTNQGGGAFAAATPISNAPVNYTSITSTDLDVERGRARPSGMSTMAWAGSPDQRSSWTR